MDDYNKGLILEDNEELFLQISSIPIQNIKEIIFELIKSEVSREGLMQEFITNFKGFRRRNLVSGENIKGYFAITLNGTSKIWEVINGTYSYVFNNKTSPLYKNILAFIDDLIDEFDFDEIFHSELNELNSVA